MGTAWHQISRRRKIAISAVCGILILSLIAAFVLRTRSLLPTTTTSSHGARSQISIDLSGTFTVRFSAPAWTFSGKTGGAVTSLAAGAGRDGVGVYHVISFTQGGRRYAIRAYDDKPIVLFMTTYTTDSANDAAFPRISSYPHLPYHLSYHGGFGVYAMNQLSTDSPWLFFDAHDHAFMLSPAANFLVASTHLSSDETLVSGIDSQISHLPAGFTHSVILVAGSSIADVYSTWGHALSDLHGKVRPANDATTELRSLGYWTDNGAAYYYHFEQPLGYQGTLLAVIRDFHAKGIPLAYLELDSWWYLKGAPPSWKNRLGGIYTYTADRALFPDGLQAFQQQLGLPLITHARWLDPASPYRKQYRVSNNVSVDPAYWKSVADYLKRSGVITYEQDWLQNRASTTFDLTDPSAFLDDMAGATQADGVTLQYCSALPRDYLQGSEYDNLTTMRVSNDHFTRAKWDQFLYDSQLAAAVGVWPWSDVFMSSETRNLLLSNLSAGMVGVGDALGTENAANLLRVIRADGVIVKPDASIVPTDATYIAEASGGATVPMVASTYSDHGSMRAAYVYAYSRGGGATASFSPLALGISGRAYVYNYFTGAGALVAPGATFSDSVTSDGSYYVVVPIGSSGIAFLGDAGKFVSLGRQRISALSDDGALHATITFAPGETAVTLHAYAPTVPHVSAFGASSTSTTYDPATHLLTLTISPSAGEGTVTLTLSPGS